MGNGCALFSSAFLSFAALILAIVACAGSTKNYNPINKIYEAQLDLSNMQVSTVLSSATSSSTSLDALGLPSYINLGLWSYCIADSSGKVSSCTSPSGIQDFNLKNMIYDNIENNQVAELVSSVAELAIPDSMQSNLTHYNNLIKCTFITLIIGIVVSFLNFAVNVLRWLVHLSLITWLGRFFSLIAFLSLGVAAGTSTGTYVYIRRLLSSSYSDYGMKLDLGRNFYAILWASVAAALLNLIVWSTVRSQRYARVVPIEEKPLM